MNVLKEYQLDEIDTTEKILVNNNKYRKNAFDQFFGENGAEEEERLVNYIKNCNLYD